MAVQYHNEFIQGSPEWLEFRKNKITATGAYKILQGESIQDILAEKLNEKEFTGNQFTERGHLLEEQARDLFSKLHPELKVYEVGAITNDDYPLYASSPDFLVDDNAGGEIKSFTEKHHKETHENIDPEIYAQIQFSLFLSGREYWWFVQFCPDIEDIDQAYYESKIYPDEEVFSKFRKALEAQPENPEIQQTALQIIDLEQQLQAQSDAVKAQIDFYNRTKSEIEHLKNQLKSLTTGKFKRIMEVGDNTLDISIHDTNRISVADPSLVPEEYTEEQEIPGAFVKSGKIYQRVPQTKLVSNLYKAGKSLPDGFEIKTSRSITLKFNGETL